ncbi:MAG: hypothetical protein JO104_11955 [Candidatus Eremiobacteraeota bacterium]|nr:hypothetical protein [Candidatus Eremiobacteraeota bacterium]
MKERLVTIVVSDPWSFPDENEGRLAFVARIVADADGRWLLRLKTPVVYEGQTWHFAVPSPRFVGQRGFDANSAANIEFIPDDQASDPGFLRTMDSRTEPPNPWVIGSVEIGIAKLILPGSDSYTEPRWVPPRR